MKTLSFSALGLLAASLALATPQASQAQSFGVNINSGRFGLSYYSGSSYDHRYAYSPYAPSYGYSPYSSGYYGSDCREGRYAPRPIVVHPESHHWTPGRGHHSHGHIHVPHRGHSHTIRY